jgi:hypothetical protein
MEFIFWSIRNSGKYFTGTNSQQIYMADYELGIYEHRFETLRFYFDLLMMHSFNPNRVQLILQCGIYNFARWI